MYEVTYMELKDCDGNKVKLEAITDTQYKCPDCYFANMSCACIPCTDIIWQEVKEPKEEL